ncbi:uncharacterized protein LOC131692253 [Topomyia yanbarensis]|uniref:uncharacterized protein LOC131692253 n=1 Tax=Topomyia yanbarensis TaxID=2498891 RepID=UPI00273AFDFB|nr:uncharacterized protein LOC131692253 [Topomyia yanbarensis]
MITNLIMTRIRHLLVAIAALLKKILCCFSRRRRAPSCETDVLASVNVVRDGNRKYKTIVEKDWNSWDDTPATVEEHIERYREQLAEPVPPKEPPPEERIDFFQDMAPTIVTQQKICISAAGGGRENGEEKAARFDRLTACIDIPVVDGLADWNEDDDRRHGWDDADENTTKQLIRETRKELRQQRQQHRNHFK